MSELDHKESWSIDSFEMWCWRRLLTIPWTARRSNQSILKEINPEFSLEGLMLKLKLQYFGHLMWRTDSLEKTLMLGKIGGRRIRGPQSMRWLDGMTWWTCVWASSRSWWCTGMPGMLQSMVLQRARHDWEAELKKFDRLYMYTYSKYIQIITTSCHLYLYHHDPSYHHM